MNREGLYLFSCFAMIIIVQQFTKNKVQSSIAFGTLWSVLFMIQSQLQIGNWKYNMYQLRKVWCLYSDLLEASKHFFLAIKVNLKEDTCKLSYLKSINKTTKLEAHKLFFHWINHKLKRKKIWKKSKVLLEISDADISPYLVFCATAHVRH